MYGLNTVPNKVQRLKNQRLASKTWWKWHHLSIWRDGQDSDYEQSDDICGCPCDRSWPRNSRTAQFCWQLEWAHLDFGNDKSRVVGQLVISDNTWSRMSSPCSTPALMKLLDCDFNWLRFMHLMGGIMVVHCGQLGGSWNYVSVSDSINWFSFFFFYFLVASGCQVRWVLVFQVWLWCSRSWNWLL